MRQRLIARNERDLAGLDLCDTPPNFGSLRCCDVSGNVVGQTLQNTVGEFRPLRSGKLLCLFENEGAQRDGADEGNCSRTLRLPTLLSITERLQSAPLMKQLLEEFKTFILKGNILTIAVGLFIAAAFGELVTAFTKGIIDPLLGKIPGLGGYLSAWAPFGFGIGSIISAVITFTAKAAVVFFCVVKPINKLTDLAKKPADPNAPVTPPQATLDDVVAALKDLKK